MRAALPERFRGGRKQLALKRFQLGDKRRVGDEKGRAVFAARALQIARLYQRRQPGLDERGCRAQPRGNLLDALWAVGAGDADVLCEQVVPESAHLRVVPVAADVHLQADRFKNRVFHVHSLLQSMFGLAQMPAQRAFGDAEPRGDLARAFVLVIKQHNRFAAQPAEPHHLASQLLQILAKQKRFLRRPAVVGPLGERIVVYARPVPRFFALQGVVGVQADAVDIAVHIRNRLLLPRHFAELGQNGLRQILGLLPVL